MPFSFSNFIIRLRNWEYWPLTIVYIPIYCFWFFLSIRARSFFYFTASNPGIEYGGMLGESKIKIMDILPKEVIPITVFIPTNTSSDAVHKLISAHKLEYPVILKPDIGERGWQVSIIYAKEDLDTYLNLNQVDLLLQEYIDEPLELGVFYYRLPNEHNGRVSSIVEKQLLTITGDGKSTIIELLNNYQRGKLQISKLMKNRPELTHTVPRLNEEVVVVPIGNHQLGTAFLDGNNYINPKIDKVFDDLSKKIDGFFFGRFDIRCSSIKKLEEGEMKIMELNGAGAEPAHIYNPGSSLWNGYKVLLHHWKIMYQISVQNHNLGVPYMGFREGLLAIRALIKYNSKKQGQ